MRKFVFVLFFFAALFLVVEAFAGPERLHPSLRALLDPGAIEGQRQWPVHHLDRGGE